MTMTKAIARLATVLALTLALAPRGFADEGGKPPQQLGKVSFANSCDAAVQERFERAVALLHSFWWKEGGNAFRDVLERDPSCAIATWGLAAIAIGNPFSSGPTPDQAKEAQDALARGRAIGAKTERERAFITAIGAYYENLSERPHRARMKALSDAFASLADRFRDDDESQIFAALYLTATQDPTDKSYTTTLRAAKVLEAQFLKHPDHPGVAHYMIHSYDYPAIADKGLAAALCYADIAPSAPHALHMPTHIFTRVGAWKESVALNTRSADLAAQQGETTDGLHATDYMVYAELQLGEDAQAGRLADKARAIAASGPNPAVAYALAAIPARYAVERGQWQDAKQLTVPASGPPFTVAITRFARALGAARSGDVATAEAETRELAGLADGLKAKDPYWATEVEVQHLGAAAWTTYAKGEHAEALKTMRAAADLEDSSDKSAVTPGRLLPARELLGDMLLESGDAAAALPEYEASLVRDPKRFRSLHGAGRAALKAGNAEKAHTYWALLADMADRDSTRPELVSARSFIAAK
jgi:tetratricopeptide (TPR) repeat protein